MSKQLDDKSKNLQGLMGGLIGKSDEAERAVAPKTIDVNDVDISSVFAPAKKVALIPKGFTIREDQAKDIEIYSKRANKKESEFVRDLLDLVFGMIKQDN